MTRTPFAQRDLCHSNFVFVGGAHGIGRAAAMEVARAGASVLLVSRGADDGRRAAEGMRMAGSPSAQHLAADLSTVAGIQAAAAAIREWRPALHGLMHTAMSAFSGKQLTADGFELAFALQYFARAALNRLLADRLAASGDGRIVHVAGNVPSFMAQPDLDDLQFDRRKWSFLKAVLGTHVLGYLHAQEAARRWAGRPVSIALFCVGSTQTKVMTDRTMPWFMRMMGRFGATPEFSAHNGVRLLLDAQRPASGVIVRNPKTFRPEPLVLDRGQAALLWDRTGSLSAERGLLLEDAESLA